MSALVKEMTGKRFGRLVVLSRSGVIQYASGLMRAAWLCRCDCGTQKVINGSSLREGHTLSCGCFNNEHRGDANRGRRNLKRWAGIGDMPKMQWTQIKRGAEKRGLTIEISHQDCWDLFQAQEGKCALTGVPLAFTFGKRITTASLDRIGSSKGYVPGNIQWVHKKVNIMKNIMLPDEFLGWCQRIANHSEYKEVA